MNRRIQFQTIILFINTGLSYGMAYIFCGDFIVAGIFLALLFPLPCLNSDIIFDELACG